MKYKGEILNGRDRSTLACKVMLCTWNTYKNQLKVFHYENTVLIITKYNESISTITMIKYVEISFPQNVQDLYEENYKSERKHKRISEQTDIGYSLIE